MYWLIVSNGLILAEFSRGHKTRDVPEVLEIEMQTLVRQNKIRKKTNIKRRELEDYSKKKRVKLKTEQSINVKGKKAEEYPIVRSIAVT